MGHDPTEHVQEEIHHQATHGEGGHSAAKWITFAALTAAFLAAFAAVTAFVASTHLTQSTLTRISANDTWNEYQSKSIKKYIMDSRALDVHLADPAKATDPAVAKQIKSDNEKFAEYKTEEKDDSPEEPKGMAGLQAKAKRLEKLSAEHLEAHETYETSATMFHIAIAIVAIAVVAKRKEFWYISIVGGVVGVYFFTSAFAKAPATESEHAEPETHSATAPEHPGTAAEKAAPASHEAAPATAEKH